MSGKILILNDSKTKNFISTSGRWKEIYSLTRKCDWKNSSFEEEEKKGESNL